MARKKSYEIKINSAKSVALRKWRDGWRLSLPDNNLSGSYWVHVKKLTDTDIIALGELVDEWRKHETG